MKRFRLTNSRYVLIIITVPLFLYPFSLQAQCDTTLKSDPNSQVSYTRRGGIRCEGMYISNVSAGGLELVSATFGKLVYDLSREEVINITSPLIDQSIHIRARGIPLKTYYRMDATLSVDTSILWPVKDILLPQNLGSEKIGLLGWYKDTIGIVISPLLANPLMNKTTNDGNIWLILRPSIDVVLAKWRYGAIKNGKTETLTQWTPCSPESFKGGSPILIKLPLMTAQFIYMEVAAKDSKSNDWLKKNFRIVMNKP